MAWVLILIVTFAPVENKEIYLIDVRVEDIQALNVRTSMFVSLFFSTTNSENVGGFLLPLSPEKRIEQESGYFFSLYMRFPKTIRIKTKTRQIAQPP